MREYAGRILLTLGACVIACACAGPGASTAATEVAAPRGSEYWERLNANKAYMRYDYPGPALTGGCVC